MSNERPWVEPMKAEYDHLEQEIGRMAQFIETTSYKGMDPEYRVVVASQFMAMCSYLSCLGHRLLLDGAAEEAPATEMEEPPVAPNGIPEVAEEGC